MLDNKLKQVCKEFCIDADYIGCETISIGNINKTYQVKCRLADGSGKSFLVQNVNTYVFKNPVQVMENIDKVTEHIRKKNPGKINLHFYHTADRKTYILDGDNFWRMTNYIPSTTYSVVKDISVIRNAGRAFGEFQIQLSDFDCNQLHYTIPDFHNTRKRYEKLEETIAADPCGKVAEVTDEIEYLRSVRDLACTLTDMQARGELPLRVTHNDTKINNVLFDPDGKDALVVVDLDTVMPGLVGSDFGDAIRFAGNYVEEDCPEFDRAGLNMEVFSAFAEGFLEKTASVLTKNEIETLPISCFALTVELAVRFLDDYIQGSPYFKINYSDHNLVRTRCQIALAKDIYGKLKDMSACIAALLK